MFLKIQQQPTFCNKRNRKRKNFTHNSHKSEVKHHPNRKNDLCHKIDEYIDSIRNDEDDHQDTDEECSLNQPSPPKIRYKLQNEYKSPTLANKNCMPKNSLNTLVGVTSTECDVNTHN